MLWHGKGGKITWILLLSRSLFQNIKKGKHCWLLWCRSWVPAVLPVKTNFFFLSRKKNYMAQMHRKMFYREFLHFMHLTWYLHLRKKMRIYFCLKSSLIGPNGDRAINDCDTSCRTSSSSFSFWASLKRGELQIKMTKKSFVMRAATHSELIFFY